MKLFNTLGLLVLGMLVILALMPGVGLAETGTETPAPSISVTQMNYPLANGYLVAINNQPDASLGYMILLTYADETGKSGWAYSYASWTSISFVGSTGGGGRQMAFLPVPGWSRVKTVMATPIRATGPPLVQQQQ